MEPIAHLPFVVHVDGIDDPADIADAMLLAPFVAGSQPWSRTVSLHRVKPDARLLPAGGSIVRSVVEPRNKRFLAVGEGWTLRVVRWSDDSANLTAIAISDELASRVLAEASDDATLPAPVGREAVTMSFWHRTGRGVVRKKRSVATPEWAAIRRNYASSVAAAFDRLLDVTPAAVSGRLLLLHGPPGTGKTTALRSVADSWRDWCQVECVLDPERLLQESGYLMEVAMGYDDDDGAGDEQRKWRLIILEDCDELIRAEAKEGSGQQLSRLLNLTDGLLGHGLEVLVALTTNEPLLRLHPAVVRPGRCLAQIEVGPLPRSEAAAWLGTGKGIGPEGATLAQLYALRGELDQVDLRAPAKVVGLYL